VQTSMGSNDRHKSVLYVSLVPAVHSPATCMPVASDVSRELLIIRLTVGYESVYSIPFPSET
jgi:hypothetical protein